MPALTTKFNASDTLDTALFCKNIEAQIDAGVSGLILGGTLGEASTLTAAEKDTLTQAALVTADDRVPVILNIAEQSTAGAVAAARRAAEIGAHGLMLLPPMRYKATGRETLA